MHDCTEPPVEEAAAGAMAIAVIGPDTRTGVSEFRT